jgi:hypothetical protein
MKLRCSICGNANRFTAEAKANVFVIIDGEGKLINPRPLQQQFKQIVVLKPWKCNSCGAVDTIEDLDKKGANGDATSSEIPTD